jgi:hypothetical protein
MYSQLVPWWDIYFYVAGSVLICLGAFAKNDWLKTYITGTELGPPR